MNFADDILMIDVKLICVNCVAYVATMKGSFV